MMKKSMLFLCLSLLVLSSCSQQENIVEPQVKINSYNEFPHFCTEILPEGLQANNLKGASLKQYMWPNGSTIKIKFLNGDAFLQNKVRFFGEQWLQYANLKFQYVGVNEDADVKILFNSNGATRSSVGTGCRQKGQQEASMIFGWFNSQTTDMQFNEVVAHEFGHMLGLIHEHQSPAVDIPWDKEKVYAYYAAAPNNWDRQTVDKNIFAKYDVTQSNYSTFDKTSIMLYSIPSSLTTNGFEVTPNVILSTTDKSFIGKLYPFASTKLLSNFYQSSSSLNGYDFYGSDINPYLPFYKYPVTELYRSEITISKLGEFYKFQQNEAVPLVVFRKMFPMEWSYKGYSPLFAKVHPYDYMLITDPTKYPDPDMTKYTNVGIIGYVFNSPSPSRIPIYVYFNGVDHYYTSSNVLPTGYSSEGVAFYLLPSSN